MRWLKALPDRWPCLAVTLIALAALAGKALDMRLLASGFSSSVPMAPSTAAALLLLCAALCPRPPWPRPRLVKLGLLLPVYALAVPSVWRFLLAVHRGQWRAPIDLVSHLWMMSPLTGAAFILLAASAILAARDDGGKLYKAGARGLTVSLGFAVITLVGYIYQVPTYYGGHIIPMAATTAASLLLLSGALLAEHGRGIWPWRLFVGESPSALIMRSFGPLTAVIIFVLGLLDSRLNLEDDPLIYGALSAAALLAVAWLAGRLSKRVEAKLSRAESSLRESEDKFRRIIDSANEGFLEIDLSTRVVAANAEMERMLGYGPGELIGLSLADDLVMPDERRRTLEHIELRKQGLSDTFEKRFKTRTGQTVWCLVSASPSRDAGGEVVGAFSFLLDITQRKRDEEHHKRLTTAIEQAGESIVITDAQGAIIYVNPAFEKATGYSRAEALGQNPRILKSGKQTAGFYREMWAVITSGRTWNGRLVNKRKDGVLREEETTISPVLDAHGKIVSYVAVKWDVTDRTEMETELRQAQKMESVGRLAGGVAHDFNNILTAIIGYAQFLEADAAAGKAQVADVKEILTAANRAASLTRQLLAFSRRQVLEPKRISLNDLVLNIQKMLERLIGEDIKIKARLSRDLPAVTADPGQVEQVLMNLAINARDAMPGGGTISVETSEILLDTQSAQSYRAAPPGIYAMVSVGDTGVGMDEATQARVFEPFFTTKAPGKGTGLGLSMVYGIVKQSGGFIYFTSAPGKGTTFKIIFPVAPAAADGPEAAPDGAPATGRETILLVEDEAPVRRIALRALMEAGYTVIEAGGGVEALRLASEHKAPIHLLLSDIVMPGMDGWTLSEHMAELFPDTKVLHMSGYTDKAALHHELESPGAHFLQKPFSPGGLVRKVRQVLDAPDRRTRPAPAERGA